MTNPPVSNFKKQTKFIFKYCVNSGNFAMHGFFAVYHHRQSLQYHLPEHRFGQEEH